MVISTEVINNDVNILSTSKDTVMNQYDTK
jgi:hypothetical protein